MSSISNSRYDTEQYSNRGMPEITVWPASATSLPQYRRLIDSYLGESCQHPSSYVAELLQDQDLNVPHDTAAFTSEEGKKNFLPRQIVVDLRRRKLLQVNSNPIYNKDDTNNPLEVFIKGFTDEEKAVVTFADCMEALGNSYALTTNVLKLSTQATLGHLGPLIQQRFYNTNLDRGIRCEEQRINIDARFMGIVTISFEAIWGIFNMKNHNASSMKFLKSNVKIQIASEDLERGEAGDAVAFEECSKFYNTKEEALKCDMDCFLWPSGAKSVEQYDAKIAHAEASEETLPPLYLKSLLHDLYRANPEKIPLEESAQFLFPDLRILHELKINGKTLYGAMDHDDPRPNNQKGEELYLRCLSAFREQKDLSNRSLHFCTHSIVDQMVMLNITRYSNIAIDRHISCLQYSIEIEEDLNSDTIELSICSIWQLQGLGKEESSFSKYRKLLVRVSAPAATISSEKKSDALMLKHYFSKFYDSKLEAIEFQFEKPSPQWLKG